MSCLMKFKWVKLPREIIPQKKGITLPVNYEYSTDFEEYQNWAGGTHAINFSCTFNVSYYFVVV